MGAVLILEECFTCIVFFRQIDVNFGKLSENNEKKGGGSHHSRHFFVDYVEKKVVLLNDLAKQFS